MKIGEVTPPKRPSILRERLVGHGMIRGRGGVGGAQARNLAFIRLTTRVCSPTRLWRSRLGVRKARLERVIAHAAPGVRFNEVR